MYLFSAKGAVSIPSPPQVRTRGGFVRRRNGFAVANLGHRPGKRIQIATSAESASQARGPERVPRRPITTTEFVEARLQRSLNAYLLC